MTNFIKKVVKQRTGVYGLNGFRVNYWEKKGSKFPVCFSFEYVLFVLGNIDEVNDLNLGQKRYLRAIPNKH